MRLFINFCSFVYGSNLNVEKMANFNITFCTSFIINYVGIFQLLTFKETTKFIATTKDAFLWELINIESDSIDYTRRKIAFDQRLSHSGI